MNRTELLDVLVLMINDEYYRYIAAGVFSKCVPNSKGCCLDPVVYTRVASLHHWIRGKAPGVRDSAGCPKKIEVGIE